MKPGIHEFVPRARTRRPGRLLAIVALLALALPGAAWADTAFLGITSNSVSGEDARDRGLSSRDGALIQKVYRDTAADAAGLRRGDIIVEFGGEKVFDDNDLTHMIRSHEPGEEVSLVVLRDGKRTTLSAELGSHQDYEDREGDARGGWVAALENVFGGRHEHPTIGVHVMELNAQLAGYFEVEEERGILITQVVRRSPAEQGGLQAGDVITRVAGSRIYRTGDISDALEERFGEVVEVALVRKGRTMELSIQLED